METVIVTSAIIFYLCVPKPTDMKKLILLLSLLLATAVVSAQSELPSDLPSDSIPRSPQDNYKKYGGFLLDMSLMSVLPPQLPKMNFDISEAGKDYNRMFRLNPDATYSQGLSNVFSSSYSGFGWFGSGSSQNLQTGSFKLKNGMRINTYGEYNANGYRVPNHSALPWEKNTFKGAFELKSANGTFGIRIEVQQGKNPYYP